MKILITILVLTGCAQSKIHMSVYGDKVLVPNGAELIKCQGDKLCWRWIE